MSGNDDDDDLSDLLGPDPIDESVVIEELVDAAPLSRPMGGPSRALLGRSRSYPVDGSPLMVGRVRKRARKNTPERLNRLLQNVSEIPVASDAARRAGTNLSQLKYWLQKSLEGVPGDGFDVALPDTDENENLDNTVRFHLAWDSAMEFGLGRLEKVAWDLGNGYDKPQVYKGRVQYQIDQVQYELFILLGLPIDDRDQRLWARDASGAPIPVSVREQDPDMVRWVLETRMPKVYGKKATVGLEVTGGVLVVGMRAATSEALNELENQYRKEGRPAVTFEETEDI